MNKTILVIDDSATIRKLVDTQLSPLGYHVILAPTAEDGLRLATETLPDLILLDHQLPGTTGFNVCQQLVEMPDVQSIPVVISSTLRNKAYAEYTEMTNVVDMLPKPYTADVLITTVANSLETGSLIVASQAEGTAVPEVIHEVAESELQGSMAQFGLREVLDFLNNSDKRGTLEIEAGHTRVWFYLDKGRIQGVASNKVDQDELLEFLPEAMRELAPVLKLTSTGGSCAQIDGVVQLLDKKVLDPRLLGRLLRYQAALLVFRCFTKKTDSFSFETAKPFPPLCKRLPLDVSLLALLVDGALQCRESELHDDDGCAYVRRAIRGQNLDRTGLSAQHMKLLGLLSEPRSIDDLVRRTGWKPIEIRRVAFGLTLAELAERRTQSQTANVIAFEPNPVAAEKMRAFLADSNGRLTGKVVRDRLALQLALRRVSPDVMIVTLDSAETAKLIGDFAKSSGSQLASAKWVIVLPEGSPLQENVEWRELLPFTPNATVTSPFTPEQLISTLVEILHDNNHGSTSPAGASFPTNDADRVLQGVV